MSALRGVIANFATGTYTVLRASRGTYVKGRYVPAVETTLEVVASVQPGSGRGLRAEAAAEHGEEYKTIYTVSELRTRTPTSDPDYVLIDGERWRVTNSTRWEAFGGVHYVVQVARVRDLADSVATPAQGQATVAGVSS